MRITKSALPVRSPARIFTFTATTFGKFNEILLTFWQNSARFRLYRHGFFASEPDFIMAKIGVSLWKLRRAVSDGTKVQLPLLRKLEWLRNQSWLLS